MATPKIKGSTLSALARISGTDLGRAVAWRQLSRDFDLHLLRSLPLEARPPFDPSPRPIQAAPQRRWDEARLPIPATTRVTGRRIHAKLAAGETTPSALFDRLAARIESGAFGDATHTPFVTFDLSRAREAAEASTRRYAEKRPLGRLDGLPVPIKDQHDMAGLPTRSGTRYDAPIPRRDATMVARLRDAGALLFAKTVPTEWGLDPSGRNPCAPMPRNAYRADRCAGGSSTGSSVAVALGFATVASATDGGGSVRTPSALEGVFGLKPTYLRISTIGDRWTPSTMGHTGCIGQSASDLADFLTAAASSADPQDELTNAPDLPGAPAEWERALGRGVRGARIGIIRSEWADAPSALARTAMDALTALEQDGARLMDVELPLASRAGAVGALVIGSETRSNLDEDLAEHADDLGDDLRLLLHVLDGATAQDYFLASRVRAGLRRQTAEVLRSVDLLALPTVGCVAPKYPLDEDGLAVSDPEAIKRLTRFSFLANLTGLPASSAPVGMHEGLPVGLQLIGDAWDEASVLAAMAQLERLKITELPRPREWFDLLG